MADVTQGGTPVVGDTSHDAVDSNDRPVKIGGKASTDEPTAVSVGDRVNSWIDTFGRYVILLGHGDPETPITVNSTASETLLVIAAPGAGLSLHINSVNIMNSGAAKLDCTLFDDATSRWRGDLAADGGGVNLHFGTRGWKLADNKALNLGTFAAGDVTVNVLEYYIAPT